MAWAAISAANVLAESNALFFIPFALVALGLVITGLALGLTATVLVFRALPLGSSGVVAVVLAAAGVVIAVLTFVTMAG